MAGLKYSIPNNYTVKDYNGLKGIIRSGKAGDTWLWEPIYAHIIISKTFGKILICHKSSLSAEEFSRISNYKGELALQLKVYDVIFGENCLYVRTITGTGDIGWYMVDESMTKGKFIGDFEIANRNTAMPFHIPVGTESIIIRVDGKDKKLILHEGEIEDIKTSTQAASKVPEEIVTHYNVYLNPDNNTVQLLHTETDKMLVQSNSIGELPAYEVIIKAMIGEYDNVPKERAEKLVKILNEFEYYGNAVALPVLFEYIKARQGGDVDTILTRILEELSTGWKSISDEYKVKAYTSGSIVIVLLKTKTNRVTVAPYMIDGKDGIMEVNEVEALVGAYKATGIKTAKLDIKSSELSETITDDNELTKWQSPYSVRQREATASDIKDFKYKAVLMYYLATQVIGADEKDYGNVGINLAICDTFTYKSKKRIGGKVGEWIETNNYGAMIV